MYALPENIKKVATDLFITSQSLQAGTTTLAERFREELEPLTGKQVRMTWYPPKTMAGYVTGKHNGQPCREATGRYVGITKEGMVKLSHDGWFEVVAPMRIINIEEC